MKASALAARDRVLASSADTSSPAAAACSSTETAAGSAAAGGRPDGGVLVPQQLLGLGRPGQQLRVEQQPGGAELVEQAGRLGGGAEPVNQLGGPRLVEERPAGAGPHRAERVAGRAEPGAGRVEVTADERDRPRPHVLLLAHHLVDALGPVGVERLVRVLEQIRAGEVATGLMVGGR